MDCNCGLAKISQSTKRRSKCLWLLLCALPYVIRRILCNALRRIFRERHQGKIEGSVSYTLEKLLVIESTCDGESNCERSLLIRKGLIFMIVFSVLYKLLRYCCIVIITFILIFISINPNQNPKFCCIFYCLLCHNNK